MITARQIRMARAALKWGVKDLAQKANINPNTISRIENGYDFKSSTIETLQRTLEEGGVIFIPANGEDEGVRLRKS